MLTLAVLGSYACNGSDPAPTKDSQPACDLFANVDLFAPACGPITCAGCCSSSGCVEVSSASACGQGGAACQVCATGALCENGSCVTKKCDSTWCKGCCDGDGSCQAGTSDEVCGTGAESCVTCKSEEACVSQRCAAKGPAMYKVTLVSAKVTEVAAGCGLSELSACDLYVTLKVEAASAKSSTLDNNNNPQWNEYLLTALQTELLQSFDVTVVDEDMLGLTTEVGSCQIRLTDADFAAEKVVFDCGYAKEVTFQFEKV